MSRTILWSFRRCPYAMRARLAVASAGVAVSLREVRLRDKPAAMLAASPKGTVPVLMDGPLVVDESLDIMFWALHQSDPEGWLDPYREDPGETMDLIRQNDGPFKRALDRYKYPGRYPDEAVDQLVQRDTALDLLRPLEARLARGGWLFGARPSLADMALLPFIRQFAHVDQDWFFALPLPALTGWLSRFIDSDRFAAIMEKYDPWQEGMPGVPFPPVPDTEKSCPKT